ncbi:DUF6483 family protein [Paenibacillus ihumii]|uniref:DUF6483 family protein n=1 Tax=Paenibacillus ihumii TaxID=687436 RepID=UPI0006D7BE4E|nr:DUF6483 family protein [Paenibacillus ihumii]
MFRKDYLVRIIEEITEALGVIFGLKQQKKHPDALRELEELYQTQFRLSSLLLGSLSPKDITELFRSGGFVEADKLQTLARLLREEGDIFLDSGKTDEGRMRQQKALHLFLTARQHGADPSLWQLDEEIFGLMSKLKGYSLNPDTERLVFDFAEEMGRYDLAENALYRLMDQQAMDVHEGIAFYERLAELDPQRLVEGGLSAAEVQEGLAELRHRL